MILNLISLLQLDEQQLAHPHIGIVMFLLSKIDGRAIIQHMY